MKLDRKAIEKDEEYLRQTSLPVNFQNDNVSIIFPNAMTLSINHTKYPTKKDKQLNYFIIFKNIKYQNRAVIENTFNHKLGIFAI